MRNKEERIKQRLNVYFIQVSGSTKSMSKWTEHETVIISIEGPFHPEINQKLIQVISEPAITAEFARPAQDPDEENNWQLQYDSKHSTSGRCLPGGTLPCLR